jgi:hypothetical protein
MSRYLTDQNGVPIDEDTPCFVIAQELPVKTGPMVKIIKEWNAITINEMRNAQEDDEDCSRLRSNLSGPYEIDDHGLFVVYCRWIGAAKCFCLSSYVNECCHWLTTRRHQDTQAE